MIDLDLHYDKLPGDHREPFEKRLSKKIDILNKYLRNYTKPVKLRVNAGCFKINQYVVELQLFLDSKPILAKHINKAPEHALEIAFTPLKTKFLQHLEKITKDQQTMSRAQRSQLLNQQYIPLQTYTEQKDLKSFTKEILPYLSDLETHIKRRIQFAQVRRIIEPHSIMPEDIVQETLTKSFEEFSKKPENLTLEQWLFLLADKALKKEVQEEHYEEETFQSWEQQSDNELKGLEENLTVDYDLEPFLTDEIPDPDKQLPSYRRTQEYLGLQTDTLDNEETRDQLKQVLHQLKHIPERMRTIFDLYVFSGFDEEDIAAMQGVNKKEVIKIVQEVRDRLKEQIR